MSEEINVSGEQRTQAAAAPNSGFQDAQAAQGNDGHGVPLAALQAERAQRQRLEDELKLIKDHVSLLQATQPRHEAPKPKDEFEGLSDTDVLTVGEAKKFMSQFQGQVKTKLDELQMTQKYPDYQDVVSRYLPEVLKTNPALRTSLQSTQDYELAYHLAKTSENYRSATKTAVRNADAERIIANASQAGSLSSQGGSSPINQAKRYRDMSDEDFKREANRNRGAV
jgi:hypothetical protein